MKAIAAVISCSVTLLLFGATGRADTNATEKTKTCFQCKGTGKMKCPVVGCKNGQAPCPGPCVQLNKGTWVHMKVDGHPDTDLWQKFRTKKGYASWNQNHVGEVIQIKDGEAVNLGKCSVCGGAAQIQCTVCKGTSEVACNLCNGKKVVPESWSTFDNPKMKARPSRFKLKDGRVLVGREVMISGSTSTIRTETGDVKVEKSEILEEQKQPATR